MPFLPFEFWELTWSCIRTYPYEVSITWVEA